MRVAWAILRKDLTVELRTLETVPAMAIFTVATFVIFHFGLQRDSLSGQLAAGVFAVSLLFAAVLGTNRLFVAEREQGGFDGFLLAPVDRTAMFLAKSAALFLYLTVLEIIAVPAFGLFAAPPGYGGALGGLIVFLLLVNLAFAILGTLVSAIAVHTRARDLIGPIIGLPLQIPALISFAIGTGKLLAVHTVGPGEVLPVHGAHHPAGEWLLVLALYDVFTALLAYAVFDFLLEE
ncbi:heme exporter protein CcmB [Conexibacter sp. DBS9H8]|uniref:heme exporter protein CcmB n=1 Tax=Conexibacter sp. DBS9H8 TaxID=2937801 RepID=UPI00201093AF|nr:heme exporter protein CcmB [Conexibacter sp. DBS9H8]